jgi:hypothetical protein
MWEDVGIISVGFFAKINRLGKSPEPEDAPPQEKAGLGRRHEVKR